MNTTSAILTVDLSFDSKVRSQILPLEHMGHILSSLQHEVGRTHFHQITSRVEQTPVLRDKTRIHTIQWRMEDSFGCVAMF